MPILHVLYLKRVKNTEKLSFQRGVLSAASLPRASHGPEFGLIHFCLHSL